MREVPPFVKSGHICIVCIYNVNVHYAVLARVQVTLSDTVIQVNYRTADQTQDYFLKLRVQR